MKRFIHSFLLISSLLWLTSRAEALSIIQTSWEEFSLNADFIGVIECQLPGAGVSKHKILGTWKGSLKEGSVITVQIGGSSIGERKVVFAKIKTPEEHPRPLVLVFNQRELITSELAVLSSYSLKERNREQTVMSMRAGAMNANHPSLRRQIKEFARLSDEMQAMHVLRIAIKSKLHYLKMLSDNPTEKLDASLISKLDLELKEAKSLKSIIEAIIHTQKGLRGAETEDFANDILVYGGKLTLALVESNNSWTIQDKEQLVHGLRLRNSIPEKSETQTEQTEATPEKLDIAQAKWMKQNLSSLDCILTENHDLLLLAKHRPEAIAARLNNLEQPTQERFLNEITSYGLIRVFGNQCEANRKGYLIQLLDAKDPIIRTGAAVYLCSEDLENGIKALEECAKLPDAAGSWAAITLACRGRKNAMPRALKVLDIKADLYKPELQTTWDKTNQLLALLSNSANASKVPQPTAPYDVWWQKYGDKITLHDPWLAEMDRLKID